MTANIILRASFSIWKYCFSVGSRDLDACATAVCESIVVGEGEIQSKGFLDLFK